MIFQHIPAVLFQISTSIQLLISIKMCSNMGFFPQTKQANCHNVGGISDELAPIWVDFHEIGMHQNGEGIETCDHTSR